MISPPTNESDFGSSLAMAGESSQYRAREHYSKVIVQSRMTRTRLGGCVFVIQVGEEIHI